MSLAWSSHAAGAPDQLLPARPPTDEHVEAEGSGAGARPRDEGVDARSTLPSGTSPDDPVAPLLTQAQGAAHARKWREASSLFEEAARLAPLVEEQGALFFNAAVAAFKAEDFARAEELFERSGRIVPATAADCHLHAALSALAQGDLQKARNYRALAPSNEGDLGLLGQVDRALVQATHVDARAQLRACLKRASSSYRAGDTAETQRRLAVCQQWEPVGSKEERAASALLHGYVAQDAGDYQTALRYYRTNLALTAAPYPAYLAVGDVQLAQGLSALALASYRQALVAAQDEAAERVAEERIQRAYPLPLSRPYAAVALSVGYDSNAAQSGISQTVGVSAPAATSSFFLAPSLSLQRPFRLSHRFAIGPYYAGSGTLLLDPVVSQYSLQGHELGVLSLFALSGVDTLRLGASVTFDLAGLSPLSPFVLEGWIGGDVELHHGTWARTKAVVGGRPSMGLSGREALTGGRVDLSVRESVTVGRTAPYLEAGGTVNVLGAYVVPFTQESPIGCADSRSMQRWFACDNLIASVIPLGYDSPFGALGIDYRPTRLFSASSSVRLEYRRYHEESYALAAPEGPNGSPLELNRKRREDLRILLGVGARMRLGAGSPFAIVTAYQLLVSRSNMAQNLGGTEHALDYDDRNFSQHVVTLGLCAEY